ncbi:MAG: hypothetical protein JWL90_169 [Chthoniobacteraceae bacterium]|nr:hypothetical protein [Chthoniobacteraceae bacterium]
MNTRILSFLVAVSLLLCGRLFGAGDSVVVVNEVHYNPSNAALEFVELHNQLSVNVDMSGWRFDGGITFDFPEGTIIPARGYLVVAKDPLALQAATGYAGAAGPFTGSLSNDGETLQLWNNNRALRTRPSPPPAPAANELWSIDIQGDGAAGAFGQVPPTPMSGAEPVSGLGNIWNLLTIAGHPGTNINPALASLKDSAGTTSSVGFVINGTISGFSYAPGSALLNDYLFLAAGNSASSVTWQLTGLNPAKVYGIWLYGSFLRSVRIKADVNGNGSIADDASFTAPVGGGVLISGIHPDAAGKIIGNADAPSGEANWSGLQLFIEPGGTPAPVETGSYSASLEKRRLMEEFSYGDSGKWPVAPDGSGFTLSKIDPQGGGMPANWAWSLGVNGTPGAVNFPLDAPWNATLPMVFFNEVSGASDGLWQCELYNGGANPVTMTGWQLVNGDTGASYNFPVTTLAAGAYLVVNETALHFRPLNNARLFLRAGMQMVDAVKVAGTSRARQIPGTGRWLRPSAPTFGSANVFSLQTGIVINEIFYHAFDESSEQWVELKNRSSAVVDLSGWKFSDGITYTFPPGTSLGAGQLLVVSNNAAALLAKYPGRAIIGNFSGSLGDGDTLTLEETSGNPADELRYEEGGRWPEIASGGGASLELRDPASENAAAESWGASATAQLGVWQTISYTAVATDDGIGNDTFFDFLLGLLDSGELLLDDVSVRENPSGANTEFIQNGTFQADTFGGTPLKWRLLGTHGIHGRTVVVADPDDPTNKCLRVVSSGHTDDKHNRIETTFASGRHVTIGNTYTISFRARWLAGSNQVNTRLYFNYLQQTSLLAVGNRWGTPGLQNSVAIANAGPVVSGVAHSPIVPAANAPVTVSALPGDPDGVANVLLFYRVNSGAWQNVAMASGVDGRYTANVPGQSAGALVQFYISATDSLGVNATWPAAGEKGGAFYRVNDGGADTSGLRGTFRVLISPENEAALFLNTNRMSNQLYPGTVIEDERTAYYQCGIGLKGSAFGRYAATEFGYSIDFPPEQPFRGVHTNVSIERAGNLKEIVAKHILNRAGGGYWSQYDDVAKVIGPGGINAPALIAAARTTSVFLKSLFPDESNGIVFNNELLYQPNGTIDGAPESLKLNNPYNHTRGFLGLADRGADKESYRWQWQLRNRRKADDYRTVIRLNRAFALGGSAFTNEIDATIDVDQWMRTWALMGLYGNDDQYGRLYPHNWRLYARPTDSRLIALPWDLDRAFNLATNSSLVPTTDSNGAYQNIQTLFTITAYKRAFDSHLLDLVNTTFNSTYLTPWINHLAAVTGQGAEFAGIASYVGARGSYALTQLPPAVPFVISTNGGADFTTAANSATLEGTGWSDVYTISRGGQTAPLNVTWLTNTTWRVTIPLIAGINAITLLAADQHGTAAGSDTITVTSNTTNVAASALNTVVSEIHYHPADPTLAEQSAGFSEADDFQFIELHNISPAAVELAGSAFTQGLTFNFTASTIVPPGGILVLARNAAAFQSRSGFAAAGVFIGRFSHSGETVTLVSSASAPITSFTYSDTGPWPASADGRGYSLILRRPQTNPDPALPIHWSSSAVIGGSPGAVENETFSSWLSLSPALTLTAPLDDQDNDGLSNAFEYAFRTNPLLPTTGRSPVAAIEPFLINGIETSYFVFRFRRSIRGSDTDYFPSYSTNLAKWEPLIHTGSVNNGDGTETVEYRAPSPATGNYFGRLLIEIFP